MLDIKFIRENVEAVKKAIEVKHENLDLDALLSLDKNVVELKNEVQALSTEKNQTSKQIPKASNEERPALIAKGKEIGNSIKELEPELKDKEEQLYLLLLQVPSIPDKNTPIGKDEDDNVEVKKMGTLPGFSFKPLDHVEILEKNNWAEFEQIARVCGSRSYSLRNEMVLLEMALHRFAMAKLLDRGFTLISAPALARDHALVGTGHFPKGKDQVYYLPEDDLYLSGTAEVQLNSLHAGEILNESDLPITYAGYSPCFRREAGSYGRDVRGLIRVHQFQKTEQYVICTNDLRASNEWHEKLLYTSEEIVTELGLPYRVIECCTGDMGTGKVKMFDIECWVPSENKYRETHSCSSLHDWQARRTNIRYRDKDGKVQFCHTLNNTAVATPRIMVPFLECHQNEDGSVTVPDVLKPYLDGREILVGKKK
ncbi:MAG: serine--tRNA ligase [Bacteriovoracaceae bacterium]|jgi:seryl-tRNA synthetase|nr:serine--tRNA ligase [Bacteriovoracaceae bacterium]